MSIFLQTQVTSNLIDLFNSLLGVLPRLLTALVVLVLGYILSKFIARLIYKLLNTTRIKSFSEKLNGIDFLGNFNMTFDIPRIISKFIFYTLQLIFIVAATDILGMASLSNLVNDIILWIPNLLTGLIMILGGVFFSDIIRKVVLTACESVGIPSARLIANVVFYFMVVNIFISALAQISVDIEFIATNISIVHSRGRPSLRHWLRTRI